MTGPASVPGFDPASDGLLSDDGLRAWLKGELDRFILFDRAMTREGLAAASRVNVHTLDALRSADPGKQRPLRPAALLSLVCVMGRHSVDGLLAQIGYGGATPLDEASHAPLGAIVATLITEMGTIATAAADGRIDHLEKPRTREAADRIIASALPLSSAAEFDTHPSTGPPRSI